MVTGCISMCESSHVGISRLRLRSLLSGGPEAVRKAVAMGNATFRRRTRGKQVGFFRPGRRGGIPFNPLSISVTLMKSTSGTKPCASLQSSFLL